MTIFELIGTILRISQNISFHLYSCKAWIEFSKSRDDLQKKSNKHNLISKLDYTESNYTFNIEVRGKINFLYKNMPDRKPSKEWYEEVISIVNERYVNSN